MMKLMLRFRVVLLAFPRMVFSLFAKEFMEPIRFGSAS